MGNEIDFDALFEDSESIIDPEVKDNPNIQPVASVTPKKTMSFNAESKVNKSSSSKKKFITKEIQIDKFNVLRRRVELTPSVCDICAFDIAAKRFGNWNGVPEAEKDKVIEAVEKHKQVVHPINMNMIVDEEQIATQWLGR